MCAERELCGSPASRRPQRRCYPRGRHGRVPDLPYCIKLAVANSKRTKIVTRSFCLGTNLLSGVLRIIFKNKGAHWPMKLFEVRNNKPTKKKSLLISSSASDWRCCSKGERERYRRSEPASSRCGLQVEPFLPLSLSLFALFMSNSHLGYVQQSRYCWLRAYPRPASSSDASAGRLEREEGVRS